MAAVLFVLFVFYPASLSGSARSALELLRHGDLVALARAHAHEPVRALRLNGRDVFLLSTTALARQVCVEKASLFTDRNDERAGDFGMVSAVGDEWARNRLALRAALVSAEASAAHARLAFAACGSAAFRRESRRADGVARAAPLVRGTTANIIAELVLGRPPRSALREVWRPTPPSAPSPAAVLSRSAQPSPAAEPSRRAAAALRQIWSRLRSRAARSPVPFAVVLARQACCLALPMRFFNFAKAFTASRAARVARARAALAGAPRSAGESDAQLVRIALAAAAADSALRGEAAADGSSPAEPRAPASVLGALLASGRSPTDPALAALLEELLVAGSATTATAALSALAAVRAEPRLARAARAEAERALAALAAAAPPPGAGGDGGRPLSTAACCPLLCACVREGMRLNPPAPLIFRVARAEVALVGPAGEVVAFVRVGGAVVMSAAVLAMDPAAWRAPGEFLVERWLPGAAGGGGTASALAEMSFGAGPRSCVGSQLAMAVAPVVVAAVLRGWPAPVDEEENER